MAYGAARARRALTEVLRVGRTNPQRAGKLRPVARTTAQFLFYWLCPLEKRYNFAIETESLETLVNKPENLRKDVEYENRTFDSFLSRL